MARSGVSMRSLGESARLGRTTSRSDAHRFGPDGTRADSPALRVAVTLPNFLVIGAGRSGTTSLHHYLAQHPAVFLPAVKSPSHFFCCDGVRVADRFQRAQTRSYFVPDPGDYERLFDGVRGETAVGEVSPVYLASTAAAARIGARLPEARLIAILRDPVERAWVRFVARRRDGLEPRADFAAIVRDETRWPLPRDDAFGTYVASGFCHHFLLPYFECFPRERIRVHLFEDLVRDPGALVADLYAFLGVDPGITPSTGERHNASGGVIRNRWVRLLWTRSALLRAALRPYLPEQLRRAVFRAATRDLVATALDPALSARLRELFRADTERLQELIGRDLSRWLGASPETAR
jgi:Sulfotransferase family